MAVKMVGGLPILEDRFLLSETYKLFIPLHERAWEDPLFIAVGLFSLLVLGVLPLRRKMKARGWLEKGAVNGYNQARALGWVDVLYGRILFSCISSQVIYKYIRGQFQYLFNPCHVICCLCLYATVSRSRAATYIARALPSALMGPTLALLFPDKEAAGYLLFEWEFFLIEHWAIVLFPFVHGLRSPGKRRFPLHKGDLVDWGIIGSSGLFLWVFTGCTWSSLASSTNINYSLYPPNFGFLDDMGQRYRWGAMSLVHVSFMFFGMLMNVLGNGCGLLGSTYTPKSETPVKVE